MQKEESIDKFQIPVSRIRNPDSNSRFQNPDSRFQIKSGKGI
jgi:hypothetical protein